MFNINPEKLYFYVHLILDIFVEVHIHIPYPSDLGRFKPRLFIPMLIYI